MNELVLGVTDFVALLNQTLEFAYPSVSIVGELANFRVSKNRWVYFDLKDELSSVKFFGMVYQLPGPLEDGMTLQVKGMPRLHPQYGFSVTVQSLQPIGEGTIRRASALLEAKLMNEGLFDDAHKRRLPYPPNHIGLITSSESAAYADFTKILHSRWGGLQIELADIQVQGEPAVGQIVRAIEYFNQTASSPEVLVLTRGGGSAEDLSAFSSEQVTRAVAASRIPTLVAIGHEVDTSLAELAADLRASTPSNAAELLVPDKHEVALTLAATHKQLNNHIQNLITTHKTYLQGSTLKMDELVHNMFFREFQKLTDNRRLLEVLSPQQALKRGYAVVRMGGSIVRSVRSVHAGDPLLITLADGEIKAKVST